MTNPTADPVLITGRRLRVATATAMASDADAPASSRYRSDPAAARYQCWTTPYTLPDATGCSIDLNVQNDPTGRPAGSSTASC